MARVPDFPNSMGITILENRRIVGDLLGSFNTLIKTPSPVD
jgi:hypothetical protein